MSATTDAVSGIDFAKLLNRTEVTSASAPWEFRDILADLLVRVNHHPPSQALEMADKTVERIGRNILREIISRIEGVA